MSFARFMEMALYDVSYGYYMNPMAENLREAPERIGWSGDFFTAPELSPILAKTLVKQVLEIDEYLNHPDPFFFMEMGGGNGTFARDFLRHCAHQAPQLLARLSYRMVECSPHLQAQQAHQLDTSLSRDLRSSIRWWDRVESVPDDSVVGVVFSNELVDAFPVHRVRGGQHHLQEIFVSFEGGEFVEHLQPVEDPSILDFVGRYGITVGEDQTVEVPIKAESWMAQVGRLLNRGIILTIDYGHAQQDYYRADRQEGTLMCYYRHSLSSNPYVRVGEQDMTAHVNFSSLHHSGKRCGLETVGFTTLANWLMGLRVDSLVEGHDHESKDVQALAQLLRPQGMGKTFKVLVQQKGIEGVTLAGLRYRAFFDDVL